MKHKLTLAILSFFLTCGVFSQTVTVVQPNGGEALAQCATYSIQWTQTGSPSNNWTIDYTLDNGSNWISIINNYYTTSGNYTWTIPDMGTSTARIRVYDSQYAFTFDESNAPFTFVPAIQILSPLGGNENVRIAGEEVNISWQNAATGGPYKVEYKPNSNWNVVTNSTSSTSINYNILGPTTNGLFRVTDLSNNCRIALSEEPIIVFKRTPRVIAPNGGEIIHSNTNYNITWSASSFSGTTLSIWLSRNGGTAWEEIVASTSVSGGSHTIKFGQEGSDNCLIKLVDNSDPARFDMSDTPFRIIGAVEFLPFAADTINSCSILPITFVRSNGYYAYSISYQNILTNLTTVIIQNWSNSNDTLTYNWTVPNLDGPVRIKVLPIGTDADEYSEYSESVVVIPAIRFISPTNAVPLTPGDVVPLVWETINTSGVYNIEWSINGSTNFTPIASGYLTMSNTYNFTVPDITATYCRFKIEDANNSCKTARSDYPFDVTGNIQTSTLVYPNSATDTLYTCQDVVISWTTIASPSAIWGIYYNTEFLFNYQPIQIDFQSTTHEVVWTVPEELANTRIRVIVVTNGYVGDSDFSDANIFIKRSELAITSSDQNICLGESVTLSAIGAENITWSPSELVTTNGDGTITASPTESTTFIANANLNGCTLSKEYAIGVIDPGLPASLTITHPDNGQICPGSGIHVEASVANAGMGLEFQWFANNQPVGTNSTSLDLDEVAVGTNIHCEVIRQGSCISSSTLVSNTITTTESQVYVPSLSVSMSEPLIQCEGSGMSITAELTPAVPNANYIWTLNNVVQAQNSSVFTPNLSEDDYGIVVLVQTNDACASQPVIASVPINFTVNPLPNAIPGTYISSGDGCLGTNGFHDILPATYATAYEWELPESWPGDAIGTDLDFVYATAGHHVLLVTPTNACGAGPTFEFEFDVYDIDPNVYEIVGPNVVCGNADANFSLGGADYLSQGNWYFDWEVSNSDWFFNYFEGSLQLYPTTGDGTISLTLGHQCISTFTLSIPVTIGETLAPMTALDGPTTVCPGSTVTYTAEPYEGALEYIWGFPSDWIATQNGNSISLVVGDEEGPVSATVLAPCGSPEENEISVLFGGVGTNLGPISGPEFVCFGSSYTYSFEPQDWVTDYIWSYPSDWNVSESGNTLTITPTMTSGPLVLGGSSPCGGGNQSFVQVSVLEVPDLTLSASPSTSICSGQQITLNASGFVNGVTWSNGIQNGVPFTPNQGGTYIATGSNEACSTTENIQIFVAPTPNANINLSSLDPQCHTIVSVNLPNGSPTGGTYSGEAVIGNTFYPSTAGVGDVVITYTYTSANGCTDTDTDVITVENCSSVDEAPNHALEVYPNPGNGTVNIYTTRVGSRITITNAIGELIYKGVLNTTLSTIELDEAAGIYFIQMDDDLVIKYIKE